MHDARGEQVMSELAYATNIWRGTVQNLLHMEAPKCMVKEGATVVFNLSRFSVEGDVYL